MNKLGAEKLKWKLTTLQLFPFPSVCATVAKTAFAAKWLLLTVLLLILHQFRIKILLTNTTNNDLIQYRYTSVRSPGCGLLAKCNKAAINVMSPVVFLFC